MEFQEKIRLLLRDEYSSQSSMEDQAKVRLCQKMIRHLQSQSASPRNSAGAKRDDDEESSEDDDASDSGFLKTRRQEKPSATAESLAAAPSLRSVLGNLSLDEISTFSNYLTAAISDRLDSEQFLPATQDEAANAEAMDGPAAQKLPRHALQAALLYVHLLQRPGGWGAGFVQSSTVTALTALLKRWRVEIQDVVTGKSQTKVAGKKRSHKKSTSVIESDSSDDDQAMVVESDDEEDQDNEEGIALTPQELLNLGLDLSHEIAKIPLHAEFLSWSPECREAMIEAVSSVLGTSSALTATSRSNLAHTTTVRLAECTSRQAQESLADCLISESSLDNDSEGLDSKGYMMSKLHETVVCICRGLYQLLSWKEVLPLGEAGKLAAATAASKVLEHLIEGLSGNVSIYQYARSPLKAMEVSNIPDKSMTPGGKTPSRVPVTPKSNRRVSWVPGSDHRDQPIMMSPKLKSTAKRASALTATKGKCIPIFSALLGLMQKITTDSAMEKASVRNCTVPTIHRCTGSLRMRERRHFLQFLIQVCHSRVAVHRLVACEIIGKVLSEVWLWTDHSGQAPSSPTDSVKSRKSLSPLVVASEHDMPTALFGALQGRLSDRVPTVRGASISALSCLLRAVRNSNAEFGASVSSMGLSESLNTELDELLELLRTRANTDSKATVRRYAVVALGDLFRWSISELTEYDLALLRDRCEDTSMMTRKAAAEALTSLVETKDRCHLNEAIQQTWISAVLPLCLDSDGSCANACVEYTQRLTLQPLLMHAEDSGDSRAVNKAWSILAKIGDGSGRQGASHNESEALKVAIVKLLESATDPGSTKLSFMRIIEQVATETLGESRGFDPSEDTRRTGIWCLFDAFVRSFKDNQTLLQLFKRKSVDVSFLSMAWHTLLDLSWSFRHNVNSCRRLRGCVRKSLYVMALSSRALQDTAVRDARAKLLKMLVNFDLPEEVIGSAVAALTSTSLALSTVGDVDAAHADCKDWIEQVYDSCQHMLAEVVGSDATESQMVQVARALHAVGECSLVGFNASEDGPASKREAAALSAKDFQARGMYGLHVKPPSKLANLVLSFLSENLAGSARIQLPENVRAIAFLAIGKFCLRNVDLAKRTLTVLARELHENMSDGSSVIQCNALLIMGDLCIKYTSLADRYLPAMAACLQSGCVDVSENALNAALGNGFEIVRKSAVILLTSLIMQDYIKWRGLLFHRFLVATSDENEEVSELAENTLSGPLLVKTPKLFFNNFVESFFVLNRCTAHPMYTAAASNGDGGSGIAVGFDGIDLSGEAGRMRRLRMYELMLSKMSDDEKIFVTAKIAREVLKSALVEGSDLYAACSKSSGGGNPSGAYLVLSDAFAVLRSENIRVGKRSSNDSEDIEDPNLDETSKKRVADATNRLMSKISRKQLIEIVVPILCNLKTMLQQNCSPLLKDLMPYLVELYTSGKNDVEEVLVNDPILLQEIQYDARQYKNRYKSNPGHETPLVPQKIG